MSGAKFPVRMFDFSRGIVAGVSDYMRNPRHLRIAENIEVRPYGAIQARKGTKRMTSGTLTTEPHSLLEWVAELGTALKYCCSIGAGGGAGVLNRIVSGGAYVAQTTPYALQNAAKLSWDQLDGALVATEYGAGTGGPFFYRGDTPANPANTWHLLGLTAPAAAPTLAAAAAGGSLTVGGVYYWRVRDRYKHGSSGSSAVSAASGVIAAPNQQITVTIPIPGTPRSDYLGWTLERTKAGGSALGPFYFVADGTAGTYADGNADADLSYRTDETLHATPPKLNGIIAHKDRLFGWVGALLYASQTIADSEATGLANWPALQAYPFGKDDGEAITSVVRQGERLIILKPSSWWALEGDDPDSFRVVPLATGSGSAGLRSATSVGSTVYAFGSSGLHRMTSNTPEPFGWTEVGNFVDQFSKDHHANVVVKNHLGQRLLVAYGTGAVQDSMLVYDQRFQAWTTWTGVYCNDILVPKNKDFGDTSSFLYADPTDRDAGAGTDFRPMVGYFGTKDGCAADGSGGSDITLVWETPFADEGAPDVIKDYERLEVYASADNATTMSCTILTDLGFSDSLSLAVAQFGSGTIWGAFLWGAAIWAPLSDSSGFSGIKSGTIGKAARFRFQASSSGRFQFKGFVYDGIFKKERRLS